MSIDGAEIDKYTREQDVVSENTADELSRRLDELETKATQFQEKTNVKLQQMNELLEKLAAHK